MPVAPPAGPVNCNRSSARLGFGLMLGSSADVARLRAVRTPVTAAVASWCCQALPHTGSYQYQCTTPSPPALDRTCTNVGASFADRRSSVSWHFRSAVASPVAAVDRMVAHASWACFLSPTHVPAPAHAHTHQPTRREVVTLTCAHKHTSSHGHKPQPQP